MWETACNSAELLLVRQQRSALLLHPRVVTMYRDQQTYQSHFLGCRDFIPLVIQSSDKDFNKGNRFTTETVCELPHENVAMLSENVALS